MFRVAKETHADDPILHHPDPNTPWIIETDASKTAFAGVLLQPHTKGGITQEVPVMFISYNFTGMQQAWSTTECDKKCVIADNNNILRIKLDYKGRILETILLPKVLRPWKIASMHELNGY